MKGKVLNFEDATYFDWTNSTGSKVSAGTALLIVGLLAVAVADIAAGDPGVMEFRGRHKIAKSVASGEVYAVGQRLGWDATNSVLVKDVSNGPVATVTKAAVQLDTTVEVDLGATRRVFEKQYTAVSGDATNTYVTFTHNFPAQVAGAVIAQVRTSAGVERATPTVTFPTATTIRVTHASLAANDVVHISANEF